MKLFKKLKTIFTGRKKAIDYKSVSFHKTINQQQIRQENIRKLEKLYKIKKYSYPHETGNNSSYNKFILLGNSRTGSSLLRTYLSSHSDIVCYDELFDMEKTVFNYIGFPHKNDKSLLKFRDKYSIEFLNKFVFRGYRNNIVAVGFKIFYHQFNNEIRNYLYNSCNLKIIHLKRRNILDSYISLKFASTTGIWSLVNHDFYKNAKAENMEKFTTSSKLHTCNKNIKLKIDFDDCKKYLEQTEKNIKYYDNLFKNHDVLEIYYEDFSENIQQVKKQIFSFLSASDTSFVSPMIKVNTKQHKDIIENYDEIKHKLANSRWAHFI